MPKGARTRTIKKPFTKKSAAALPVFIKKKPTEKISQKGNTRKRN